MNAVASTPTTIVADGFQSGLAGTIGYRVRDDQGGDAIARTTAGVVEDIAGSGIYRATIQAPAVAGQYTIVWDDGQGGFATEELVVTGPDVVPSSSVAGATEFSITGERGTNLGFLVTVTRNGAAIDLTTAGMILVVTGKLTPDEATPPLFVKDYYQAGGAPHGGITVGGANPTNVADVELAPADTIALTRTSYVLVDALLIEPNGRETIVSRGVLKLRATPST